MKFLPKHPNQTVSDYPKECAFYEEVHSQFCHIKCVRKQIEKLQSVSNPYLNNNKEIRLYKKLNFRFEPWTRERTSEYNRIFSAAIMSIFFSTPYYLKTKITHKNALRIRRLLHGTLLLVLPTLEDKWNNQK